MAHQTQDDGFHEIQLNGKQLVFLFMAATVVSVVIFLCGVLVGRGVRADRGGVADADAAQYGRGDDAAAAAAPVRADTCRIRSDEAAAPPAVDDLTYFNRLEKPIAGEGAAETGARRRRQPGAGGASSGAAGRAAAKDVAPPPAVPRRRRRRAASRSDRDSRSRSPR